jgi:ABC-type branched-subunit amino acid transport system ATPase component
LKLNTTDMTANLTIRKLRAGYGGVHVLHGIDLDVPAGQLTVVVGPNGAGKSTLLKALSGLMPHEGEVRYCGAPLPPSPAGIVKAGLAHVPEGRQLFAQMAVEDNLELGAYLRPAAERGERMEKVFDLFPKLRSRRRQLAGTMSGGEQQMLAVGRALMGQPQLLMLGRTERRQSPGRGRPGVRDGAWSRRDAGLGTGSAGIGAPASCLPGCSRRTGSDRRVSLRAGDLRTGSICQDCGLSPIDLSTASTLRCVPCMCSCSSPHAILVSRLSVASMIFLCSFDLRREVLR